MKFKNLLKNLEHPDEKYEAFFDLELKYRIKIGFIYFWPVMGTQMFNFAIGAAVFLYVVQVAEVVMFLNKKSRRIYKKYFLWIIAFMAFSGGIYGFLGYDYFESFGSDIAKSINKEESLLSFGDESIGLILIFMAFITSQYGAGLILRASRRLYTEKAGMEADIRFAREVQQSILQDVSIKCGKSEAYGCSYPANELGGDFFELKEENRHIFATVGDVSGHSFGAGLIMTMLKSAYYTHLDYLDNPTQIMAKLNELMINQSKRNMFATMVIMQIDTVDKQVKICNAGHLPVLHYRANAGELNKRHQKGIGLGITSKALYSDLVFNVQPGDLLFLYSDGLTEIRDEQQQVREPEFFERIVKKHVSGGQKGLKQQTREIIEEVNKHHQRHRLDDDATLLAIKI